MKARVKQTGEIVEIDYYMDTNRGKMFGEVTNSKTFRTFYRDEIEFISFEDTEVVDYWESLKHQYAGMAMQSLVEKYFTASREVYAEIHAEQDRIYKDHATALAKVCDIFAHALVEKLKEKEERK